jgi:hypothetical protein
LWQGQAAASRASMSQAGTMLNRGGRNAQPGAMAG